MASAMARMPAEPVPLSLMPAPSGTPSRCAPTTTVFPGSPVPVSARTFGWCVRVAEAGLPVVVGLRDRLEGVQVGRELLLGDGLGDLVGGVLLLLSREGAATAPVVVRVRAPARAAEAIRP